MQCLWNLLLRWQQARCEVAVQALQGPIEGQVVLQCVYEDGTSEHRVCIFEDIVLWNGELLYLSDGTLVTMQQTPLETLLDH